MLQDNTIPANSSDYSFVWTLSNLLLILAEHLPDAGFALLCDGFTALVHSFHRVVVSEEIIRYVHYMVRRILF